MSRAAAPLFPVPSPPQLALSPWDRVMRRVAAGGFILSFACAGPVLVCATLFTMSRLYRGRAAGGAGAWLFRLLCAFITLYGYTYASRCSTDGGAEQKWWRRSRFFAYLIRTYDMRAYQMERLPENGQYVFACHPHGVIPCGWMTFFQQFPSEPLVISVGANFVIPVQREMTLFSGGVDADEATFRNVLQAGRSVCLFPGGVSEMIDSRPQNEVRVHNKNKGFIRLAIQHGVPIVPCFSYTEQHVYTQWIVPLPQRFMAWFKETFGWYLFLPLGVGPLFVFPNLDHSRVVIGRPIPVTQQASPSPHYVSQVHTRVYRELLQLVAYTREAVGHPDKHVRLTNPLPSL